MESLGVAKFVERELSHLYLLPVDMREWLPEDDLTHFVVGKILPGAARAVLTSIPEPASGTVQAGFRRVSEL